MSLMTDLIRLNRNDNGTRKMVVLNFKSRLKRWNSRLIKRNRNIQLNSKRKRSSKKSNSHWVVEEEEVVADIAEVVQAQAAVEVAEQSKSEASSMVKTTMTLFTVRQSTNLNVTSRSKRI